MEDYKRDRLNKINSEMSRLLSEKEYILSGIELTHEEHMEIYHG